MCIVETFYTKINGTLVDVDNAGNYLLESDGHMIFIPYANVNLIIYEWFSVCE